MDAFWEYFSVLAPSVGLGLIFWLVMRSLFRADTGERNARAELEEREAREWARLRAERGSRAEPAPGNADVGGTRHGRGNGAGNGTGEGAGDENGHRAGADDPHAGPASS